jgi:geranylgeranyl pyrophosphate synthase
VTTLEAVVALPGVDEYMAEVEERLAVAVGSQRGRVAAVGADALAAGGKRLRPLLRVPLRAAGSRRRPLPPASAVELVHMATLVHDDLVDGGQGTARQGGRLGGARRRRRPRDGRLPLSPCLRRARGRGRRRAVAELADACLCLARGEAMQRRQLHDPDTTVERTSSAAR